MKKIKLALIVAVAFVAGLGFGLKIKHGPVVQSDSPLGGTINKLYMSDGCVEWENWGEDCASNRMVRVYSEKAPATAHFEGYSSGDTNIWVTVFFPTENTNYVSSKPILKKLWKP